MIIDFVLNPIHDMSLFIISTPIERCEETKQEEELLKSKMLL